LDDWEERWAQNRQQFLDKWRGDGKVARVAGIDDERFARNRRTAAAAAGWMAEFFDARDRVRREHQLGVGALVRRLGGRTVRGARDRSAVAARSTGRSLLHALPPSLNQRVRR